MERREKYSFGDKGHRKARLHRFEEILQRYIEQYRLEWEIGPYQLPREEELLLQRLEEKQYQKNHRLLPQFYMIDWDKKSLGECLMEIRLIWERENGQQSG